MLGAIVGDIAGPVYEWNNIKTKDFPLFRKDCFFTDDTVSSNSLVCEFVSETLLILKIKKPKFHYFEMKT
ncbi:hydrolase [Streptococcus oralis subsp. tigurinus AZ_3a]|nr:hydrolase [Streptococcus oralis subsp. tigurinus AZ_3a]